MARGTEGGGGGGGETDERGIREWEASHLEAFRRTIRGNCREAHEVEKRFCRISCSQWKRRRKGEKALDLYAKVLGGVGSVGEEPKATR